MTIETETGVTTQVYQVFIKATPQAIWDAITKPEWNRKYGYMSAAEYDLRPGGVYRVVASPPMIAHGAPDVIVDGEVIEADPPRKLVQTWRAAWEPELLTEGFKRVTWEIDEGPSGVSKLTLTHELSGAPRTATIVSGKDPQAGGGWSWILSDLKTLLETGKSLAA